MGKAIIYLADGTEECEALLCADLLRRAGAEVVLAAVGGRREIVSSHGVAIRADALAEEADIAGTDLLVLPGGWPGTKHLEDCPAVREAILAFAAAGPSRVSTSARAKGMAAPRPGAVRNGPSRTTSPSVRMAPAS